MHNGETAITMISLSLEEKMDDKQCEFAKFEEFINKHNSRFDGMDYKVKTAAIKNSKEQMNKVNDKLDTVEYEVGEVFARKLENLKQISH